MGRLSRRRLPAQVRLGAEMETESGPAGAHVAAPGSPELTWAGSGGTWDGSQGPGHLQQC